MATITQPRASLHKLMSDFLTDPTTFTWADIDRDTAIVEWVRSLGCYKLTFYVMPSEDAEA